MIIVYIYMIMMSLYYVTLSNYYHHSCNVFVHCFQQQQQSRIPLFIIKQQQQQRNYRYDSRIETISNSIITKLKQKQIITKRNYLYSNLNTHSTHNNNNDNDNDNNNNNNIPKNSFIYINNNKNYKRKRIIQRRPNFLTSFRTILFSTNSNNHKNNNENEENDYNKNIDYDANLNDSSILLEVNNNNILKSIRKNARKVSQQQQYRNYHNLSKIFSDSCSSSNNNTNIGGIPSNNKRIKQNDNNDNNVDNDDMDSNVESSSSKVNISSQIVLSDFCIHVQINSNDYNHLPRSVTSIVDETLIKIKNYQMKQQSFNGSISLHYDDNNHDDNNNNNVINRTDHRTMNNNNDTTIVPMPKFISNDDSLKALELIQLGSVWFISKKDNENDDNDMIQDIIIEWKKPNRIIDPNFICHDGDYLRIHHQPRRFQNVYQYNWNGDYNQDDTTITTKNDQQKQDHDESNSNNNFLPGVIIARDDEKGYIVINKPPMIPVHMTVDNSYENVASCLLHVEKMRRKNKKQSIEVSLSNDNNDVTVLTPQRLDQNTSGLLVVATSKLFANYYANLLRMKTKLSQQDDDDQMNHEKHNHVEEQNIKKKNGHINKLYRCLICLMTATEEPSLLINDDANRSRFHMMTEKMGNEIYEYVNTGKIMKHYLEPSIRSPKLFVKDIPDTVSSSSLSSWPVCLLRITKASPIYPVFGDTVASVELAKELWMTTTSSSTTSTELKKQQDDDKYEYNKPKNCYGVMEIEIELLTGRTHQIRGQLSASGYPIVGDVPYGGAVEVWNKEQNKTNYYSYTEERLALQCCQLEFYDPDIIETKRIRKKRKTNINSILGYDVIEEVNTKVSLNISNRLNTFNLHNTWWAQSLQKYNNNNNNNDNENNQQISNNINTYNSSTIYYSPQNKDLIDDDSTTNIGQLSSSALPSSLPRAHLLPPRVQLSPGKNKYILLRATHPNDYHEIIHWFIKSASPQECGGPYHGNVAQDLREWIEAIGYNVIVTGGGRIDYRPTENTVFIYGSSNGFGKGNHKLASQIISQWSNGTIQTTYDDTDGLY